MSEKNKVAKKVSKPKPSKDVAIKKMAEPEKKLKSKEVILEQKTEVKTEEKKESKQRKPSKKKESPFLIKRGDDLYFMTGAALDSFSAQEAFNLGIAAYIEQHRQLMLDALHGDHFIDNVRVVDGLEASLTKLSQKFPDLLVQLDQMGLQGTHFRIGKC